MTRRNRRGGRWGLWTIVAFSIAALIFIYLGVSMLWVQHFGVPARITVVS